VEDFLSTTQLGWLLDRSPGAVRAMIRDGSIAGVRLPAGFRIPKAEVLRVARDRIEGEAGRTLDDRELEALIDTVIETNEERS
jgi:hypothetical protein